MSWSESVEHLVRSAEYLAEIAIIRGDTLQGLQSGLSVPYLVRTARQLYAEAWRREQERAPSRFLSAPLPLPTRQRPTRRVA